MVVKNAGDSVSSTTINDRTNSKYRTRTSCVKPTDYKSNYPQNCCPYDGMESGKRGGKFGGTLRVTGGMKKITPFVTLTKNEYKVFRECGEPMTIEEQKAALKLKEMERENLMKESLARREEFHKIDKRRTRVTCPLLIEIQDDAKKRTSHVLERAKNMKLEQEEEIQKCSRMILETKCRAIRDAQIAEKRLIEREFVEEEKRLNDMMENERRWAIREEIKKEQEEAAKRLAFANSLADQIKENEENRLLEFERKQEESRLVNLSNIAWQQEEIAKLKDKQTDHIRTKQFLTQGNEQLKHLKMMEEQENRIIDERIREYQRKRKEREDKLAEERKLEKLKKEVLVSKIATRAGQSKDFQEQLDEINAARAQEETERQWRQKEKQEAIRKAEALKHLKAEREKQINHKRLMQAFELERERKEFEKIVRVQKEFFCREQKVLEKKQREALIHRNEILRQVNEKEREKIEARRRMFEEGLAIRTEAAIRKKTLRETMGRKCDEMRTSKIPEIYINEVKRMIDTIQ